MEQPTPGRIVLYRTDGRNGLVYDLPAIITVTPQSHPGDYPDGSANPLPVPDEGCVHLTVFTPGGYGIEVVIGEDNAELLIGDEAYKGATRFTPGSGTYVEHNVPQWLARTSSLEDGGKRQEPEPRTWRWPR